MKNLLVLVLALIALPVLGFGQTNNQPEFNESAYAQTSKGTDPDNAFNRYVILYKNTQDTSYTLKKVYADSAYTEMVMRAYFKRNIPEGPFTVYTKTKVLQQGNYHDGFKTDVWEEYGTNGQIVRRITYGSSGKVLSDTAH